MAKIRWKPGLRLIVEIALLISFIGVGALIVWQGFSPATAPSLTVDEDALVEAKYWAPLDGNKVQCQLCFRQCIIAEGQRGYCTARQNHDGRLYSMVYGQVTSQIDPVEKEPLLHFLPGTKTLCFGTAGCNFRCSFCHNWHLASRTPEDLNLGFLSAEDAVNKAKEMGCTSISFTYNEPTVFYEWVYDVSRLAKKNGLKTYFHTNGAISPEPLKELLKHMDAVCIDLKAFTADFYQVTSFSDLEPVLDTLKILKEEEVWFEITNLIIPTFNDDPEQIREMCIWIRENLGKDIPVHFSRFFPAYRLTRIPPTPIETLEKAIEIATEEGLEYITIGNVPGHDANSTFCPNCGEVLIQRVHFHVLANNIEDGKCRSCNHPIPGIWR